MSDGNPRYQEVRSDVSAPGGLRGFQFSLASMLVVMTLMATILSAFFTAGRLVGMSTIEVLTRGLGQFLFLVPLLLVWIVGLTMAIRRLKRNRVLAILTMIALGALIATSFAGQVIQMALIHLVNFSQISQEAFAWSLTGLGVLYAVVNTTCWILILAAIFRHRPPDASQTERTDPNGDPFRTNEPAPVDDGLPKWEQP
jgi:uncharacterized BrkB/YihY/UPF0761 family membrane protein